MTRSSVAQIRNMWRVSHGWVGDRYLHQRHWDKIVVWLVQPRLTKCCRWYFPGSDCSDPGKRWRTLSLHTAAGPGQFCCASGLCLPSELKCDSARDCPDTSDETNCSLLERNNHSEGFNLQVAGEETTSMISPGKISSFNSPILVEVDHENIFKWNLFLPLTFHLPQMFFYLPKIHFRYFIKIYMKSKVYKMLFLAAFSILCKEIPSLHRAGWPDQSGDVDRAQANTWHHWGQQWDNFQIFLRVEMERPQAGVQFSEGEWGEKCYSFRDEWYLGGWWQSTTLDY